MDPGRFDLRVTLRRRPEVGSPRERGAYADAFPVWANFRTAGVRELVEGGQATNVESGALTLRDSAQARTITGADRVVIRGRDFAIEGVGLPDRRTGLIVLSVATKLGGQ
ncbi:head-tail adaptor protein [Methylobacterium sp. Leaf102]|uniref:phage head completion protein n=1 Tax=Methylobacterium sp. Leaf102 TaxID=1736253 RepID=UPI0007012DAF|nr:head-tail adaptor protein [Methylobacterium sp. Leaf102]KQP34299.1 head-tail adaptor protein [Methylobacterium sp. Leaf102]